MTGAVALFLAGVAMASSGQLLIKKGAMRGRARSVVGSFFDVFTISGYVLMLGSTVTSTLALKILPLRITVSLLPLGYIVVAVLSVAILGERMRRHHILGMLIILAGVVIFNLGGI